MHHRPWEVLHRGTSAEVEGCRSWLPGGEAAVLPSHYLSLPFLERSQPIWCFCHSLHSQKLFNQLLKQTLQSQNVRAQVNSVGSLNTSTGPAVGPHLWSGVLSISADRSHAAEPRSAVCQHAHSATIARCVPFQHPTAGDVAQICPLRLPVSLPPPDLPLPAYSTSLSRLLPLRLQTSCARRFLLIARSC